uniref:MyoD family inhibitor domain containing n=1 Tax=Mus musculus TaxID=10090 RepID=D6REI0_MOUSE
MSCAGEALAPGPAEQQCPVEAGGGRLGSPAHDSRPHDLNKDDSHTCAFRLCPFVVSGMKLELRFYASTYILALTFESTFLSPEGPTSGSLASSWGMVSIGCFRLSSCHE